MALFLAKNGQNLALSLRKWQKKNQIGENSGERKINPSANPGYAITCDVIAYHLVHFVSIRLINKCQSGIDFIFTSERAIYSTFMKISVPSQVFRGKTK